MALRTRANLELNKMMNLFDSPLTSPAPPKRPYMLDANSYFQARQAVDDAIGNLQDVLPALSKEDRIKLYDLIGPIETEDYSSTMSRNVDIDEVTEQYQLVQHIRRSVLDPSNTIKHGATTRELTALVSAMSNLSNLFFRQKDKVELMQEVQAIKRAVSVALEECTPDVKERFIATLERARSSSGGPTHPEDISPQGAGNSAV